MYFPSFHFSLSECYFAGKGTALMLGSNERLRSSDGRRLSSNSSELSSSNQDAVNSDIQQHLQSMFYLLRPEETLKMVRNCEELFENCSLILFLN